jgi:hypothetical protein
MHRAGMTVLRAASVAQSPAWVLLALMVPGWLPTAVLGWHLRFRGRSAQPAAGPRLGLTRRRLLAKLIPPAVRERVSRA